MKRRTATRTKVDGVPAELVDPSAPVWHDRAQYLAYMDAAGYRLSIRDRFGLGWSESRRRAAVEGWAYAAGIVRDDVPQFLDYRRLDGMGAL